MQSAVLTLNQELLLNDAALMATAADASTVLHGAMGAFVAGHILSHENPSMREAIFHAGASSLDLADGRLKRRAVAKAGSVLFPEIALPEDSKKLNTRHWDLLKQHDVEDHPELDHLVDKGYFYIVMGALMKRAATRGNNYTATAIGINLAIAMARDGGRELQRIESKKLGGGVSATAAGKHKTFVQSIGLGVMTSPLARLGIGRLLGVGLISYSNKLGISDYISNLHELRYRRIHPNEH